MVGLIGSNINLDKIDNLFNEKLENRKLTSIGKQIEMCIYDTIVQANKNRPEAFRYLDFINKLCGELSELLNEEEKKLISLNIYNMLISFDLKYLNFFGEILVLNNLMKTKKYRLHAVEIKLSNGKEIDFVLQSISSNNLIQIEIVNLQPNEKKVEPDNNAIRAFLTKRLIDKIKTTQIGLNDKSEFILIPVIWGSAKVLKIYYDFFQRESIQIENVLEPHAYGTFIEENGVYIHRFCKISNLFTFNPPRKIIF
jgi:hypothetical protein